QGGKEVTDTKEEFVAKVLKGIKQIKEEKKLARISTSWYFIDKYNRRGRLRAKRTKQGRKP
ncbi:MAG: hypothetical protein IIW62_03035, partial [Selenomonadales bacterium]|nr:hypothetical protein [Selenomonadales bacterium]